MGSGSNHQRSDQQRADHQDCDSSGAKPPGRDDRRVALPLEKAAEFLIEECRMVLPGLQGLFGFQLIAVFSAGFEKLPAALQDMHLVAIALIVVSIALIMTPAAYHRQTDPHEVSDDFIRLCTRLLLASMVPLTVGLCLDFYIVARVVVHGAVACWSALAAFAIFVALWFLLPRMRRSTSARSMSAQGDPS